MAKYVLLLKSGDFSGYSPEEMQRIVEKYLGWGNRLREQARYHGGEELNKNGRILRRERNQVVDGPFTETKEAVGGFFMIEAKDYDEATAISRECPHLEFGGEIEIREVIPH